MFIAASQAAIFLHRPMLPTLVSILPGKLSYMPPAQTLPPVQNARNRDFNNNNNKKGYASLLMLQEDQDKLLLICTSSLSSVQYEISCLTKQRAPKNNTNKKKTRWILLQPAAFWREAKHGQHLCLGRPLVLIHGVLVPKALWGLRKTIKPSKTIHDCP